MRIIDKKGPVHNPADRDQCLQYMTTIGLIFGELTADHYEDTVAADPLVDALRERMIVVENPDYSRDNLDTQKRSIANAVQVFFKDETSYENLLVEYPLRHRWRREEGILLLMEKLSDIFFGAFPACNLDASWIFACIPSAYPARRCMIL